MRQKTTDRIEKSVLLRSPRARVWRALTSSREFGQWFGAAFTEPFSPGATVAGRITHKGYEHLLMTIMIEKMVPEGRFSYRWHPHAVEAGVDYSSEPPTLVTFTLEDAEGGTLLKVVESGFDLIPLGRRAAAYKGNDSGWEQQMTAIDAHLKEST
jgi:uncharacterized protein YndB with AHSA1/START domain